MATTICPSTTCPSAEELTKRLSTILSLFDYLIPKLVQKLAGQKVTAMRLLAIIQGEMNNLCFVMSPKEFSAMKLKTIDIIKASVIDETVSKKAIYLWNCVNVKV